MPFGATIVSGGVNFSVFSKGAVSCSLLLYHRHEEKPFVEIPFREEFRIGNVFSMIVYDLDYEDIEYAYRFDGPNDFRQGYWFDKTKALVDPYARALTGRDVWGAALDKDMRLPPFRSRILLDDFDWQGDKPLETLVNDLIVYEMHVRGFTADPSSGVKFPGTFAAITEKIPYIKELGVNCVELLPIYEYDEFENWRYTSDGKTRLLNYWGYSTVGFFAPKSGLAATGKFGMQADELKTLVRTLHKNGIEVILDVVFNHTAEGNENGPYISFRGIDNNIYYMLTPEGYYYNFSGCGNTLNCNNPIVRNMILDCLRYWASDYHIDGFRFDLATILGRNQDGSPMTNPPLLENLAFDPVLGKCKLIAEAWDAGGLYQVGSFPSWGRWMEWNGKYRDDVRKFLKGEPGVSWLVAQDMCGSPHVYNPRYRGNCASVNFITCHDGFTLMDIFSYNGKNNYANGENNNDGSNDNISWDCWVPGFDEGQVQALRQKMVKNALTILMLSHGVPMLLSGDEFGNSQGGNNNAYCQDNPTGWLDWNDKDKNQEIFRFARRVISLRKAHECLRSPKIPRWRNSNDYPVISYHGVQPWNVDYSGRIFAVMFAGDDDFVYVALNMHWEGQTFYPPALPEQFEWTLYEYTEMNLAKSERIDGDFYTAPRSAVILVSRKKEK
jgi:glycogen operon protein